MQAGIKLLVHFLRAKGHIWGKYSSFAVDRASPTYILTPLDRAGACGSRELSHFRIDYVLPKLGRLKRAKNHFGNFFGNFSFLCKFRISGGNLNGKRPKSSTFGACRARYMEISVVTHTKGTSLESLLSNEPSVTAVRCR